MGFWTRNEQREAEILSSMWKSMGEERDYNSVSSLVYCLTKSYYKKFYLPQIPDPSEPEGRRVIMLFYVGLALEKVILSGEGQDPQYLELDGITGHSDHRVEGSPLEVKSTRMTAKRPIPDDLPEGWQRQFLSYCKMEGSLGGEFLIAYLFGDYAPPFPDVRVFDVKFTQEEVDDNWAWMLDRKATLEDFMERKVTPPPFTYNFNYECAYCEYKPLCTIRQEAGI